MSKSHIKFTITISICFLLFCVSLSQIGLAQIQINEIMYNPSDCSDSDCEWIELYNPSNESYSLEYCNLSDKEIGNETIAANEYLILARDSVAFNQYFSEEISPIEVSMSLNNGGELIELSGTEWCDDSIDYTSYTDFADGNNYSLEKSADNNWYQSLQTGGSPGEENSVYLLSSDYSSLHISELLPNPQGDDDAEKPFGEWIELFNSGDSPINLDALFFEDESEGKLYISDTTAFESDTIIEAGEYKIIFRNADSDFSLNNNGYESIGISAVANDETVTGIDSMSYSGSTELMSWSLIEGEWQETVATPNQENEYLPYCDWGLSIDLDESIILEDELDFAVQIDREYGDPATVTVRGEIIEYNGEIAEEYSPWTNASITTTSTTWYSPNLNEGIYELFFWIEDLNCNEYNLENNNATQLIAINPEYKMQESYLIIDEVYLGSDESAEWGDQIRVAVSMYKGEETKYAIELYALMDDEIISKRTKLNIYEEYQYYTLTLPIQLDANCDGRLSDGSAKIILEGLDLQTETTFEIEDIDQEICTDYFDYLEENGLDEEEDTEEASIGSEEYQFIEIPETASPGELIQVTVAILADEDPHSYTAYAYLYRGSWCYSCEDNSKERNDTMVSFSLAANELHQETFLLALDEGMESGDYSIKVRFRKDDRKTDDELTADIILLDEEIKTTSDESSIQETSGSDETSSSVNSSISSFGSGVLIYQSTGKQAGSLVPTLLLISCTMLICLLWYQKN